MRAAACAVTDVPNRLALLRHYWTAGGTDPKCAACPLSYVAHGQTGVTRAQNMLHCAHHRHDGGFVATRQGRTAHVGFRVSSTGQDTHISRDEVRWSS